jgi:uncharacterized protein (TIGR02118 family)
MIKVSVFYPYSPSAKFDMGYYLRKHIPMVQGLVGSALKSMAVEQGLAGGAPGAAMTYTTMAHLTFDSTESFQAAFGTHAAEIMADVPNYTDIQPIIQVSEIKL